MTKLMISVVRVHYPLDEFHGLNFFGLPFLAIHGAVHVRTCTLLVRFQANTLRLELDPKRPSSLARKCAGDHMLPNEVLIIWLDRKGSVLTAH